MPYVQRNEAGVIVSLTASPVSDLDQFVEPGSPEIIAFLSQPKAGGAICSAPDAEMSATELKMLRAAEQLVNVMTEKGATMMRADLEMIRVLEDLIHLLINKGVFMFSDLPVEAQRKLMNKEDMRQRFTVNEIIADDVNLPV